MTIPRSAIVLLALAALVIEFEALSRSSPAATDFAVRPAVRSQRPLPASATTLPTPEEPDPGPSVAKPPAPQAPSSTVTVEDEPRELTLTRIVRDAADPEATFAVVSGRAVRAGDRIGDRRITEVGRDRVRLDDGRELAMNPDREDD